MSKNGRVKGGLADPSRLQSMDQDDGDIVQVVIETPKGSRNKYAFDPDQKVFELKKVLPAGMTFPYDFGSRKIKNAMIELLASRRTITALLTSNTSTI